MKRPLIAFLSILAIFALACGFLDSEIVTLTHEEGFPVTIPINANELCPDSESMCEHEGPSPTEVTLFPIEFGVDIDLVEAADGDIERIVQELRTLTISSIDYKVEDNDLTFDIPELRLFVGPEGSDDIEDSGVIPLATVPVVDAGDNPEGRAEVKEAYLGPASDLFKELEFAILAAAQPVVKEGQMMPPSGDAEYELTFNIILEYNPLD